MPLFSVGLNGLEKMTFLEIVKQLNINYMIDIRHPLSKTKAWCRPINLKEIKGDHEMKYVFWVNYVWSNLPGLKCETIQRPKISVKENNHIDHIVKRLIKAHAECRAILCCSHENLSDCIVGKIFQPVLKNMV